MKFRRSAFAGLLDKNLIMPQPQRCAGKLRGGGGYIGMKSQLFHLLVVTPHIDQLHKDRVVAMGLILGGKFQCGFTEMCCLLARDDFTNAHKTIGLIKID